MVRNFVLLAAGFLLLVSSSFVGMLAAVGVAGVDRWPWVLLVPLIVSVLLLLLLSLTCFRYVFDARLRYYGWFSRSWSDVARDLVWIAVATCLLLSTLRYSQSDAPMCGERLGAGFPLAFVCNDSGGSPLSSATKIDRNDLANVRHIGLSLNLLVYLTLVWGGKTMLHKALPRG